MLGNTMDALSIDSTIHMQEDIESELHVLDSMEAFLEQNEEFFSNIYTYRRWYTYVSRQHALYDCPFLQNRKQVSTVWDGRLFQVMRLDLND